jgi:hypothetical protein
MTGRRFDWNVRSSWQTDDGIWCVDIFERADGSFGFEQFRRDPEDSGPWTRISALAEQRFPSIDAAIAGARRQLTWFDQLIARGD